jgi:cytoskeletal protein RodZ
MLYQKKVSKMKGLTSLLIAFLLGIFATVVLLPKLNQPEPTVPSETTQNIEETFKKAVEIAVNEVLEKTETIPETNGATEPTEETSVTEETTTENITEAITETTTPPEVKVSSTPKPASSPPVTPTQPETWWEDGKQYTMINGHKAEISPEGNNQLSYYDWESDPLKDVPGAFTGNGN